MQNLYAVPFLVEALKDETLNPMVRHEAAEALGALGGDEALAVLHKYKDHKTPEIRDTCLIAIDLINWKRQNKEKANENMNNKLYCSVDPAPPSDANSSIPKLQETLLDRNLSIFERYRAMFALRNIGTSEAVAALVSSIENSETEGAVFAHEVAYVLGQIQHKDAVDGLTKLLKNSKLNCMIRHEAAEALGAIDDEKVVSILQDFSKDESQPVRQSCVVALDIYNYNQSDEFQYADCLTNNT